MSNNVYSMTGFGKAEYENKGKKITVEIKSVNHKATDINLKMPRKFNVYDSEIRSLLKKYIKRGKVDVFVSFEDLSQSSVAVKYNKELAREYISNLRELGMDFGLVEELKPTVIARFPEVFSLEEVTDEDEELLQTITTCVNMAGEAFATQRMYEGENLRKDILGKITNISALVDRVEVLMPTIIEEYKAKLKKKVEELLGDNNIDESRIAMEVVIFSDKICVDEEMVRLKSHVDSVRRILEDGGECGRKLDFIIQEMNREANTTLSKSGSLEVTDIGIALKTEIEKIREQIQNLE